MLIKKIFNFEIRNKKKLGGYLIFSLIMIVFLFAFSGLLNAGMNNVMSIFLGKLNSTTAISILSIILAILLLMQIGRTNEFSSVETGITEYKERGILAYVSRASLILVLALFILCICN